MLQNVTKRSCVSCFGGVSEMKYIFLLFLSHGFKSQAAHLYIATGDQVKVRACVTQD